MAGAWWVWLVALVLYGAFRFWYDNRRGPLRPDEVEAFLASPAAQRMFATCEPAAVRAFLLEDDGREFIMSNLVRVHPGEVPHPQGGGPVAGWTLLQAYGQAFVRILLRHGGHPVLAMRKVGGYIDAWNTAPDPGWHVASAMRYRSRRDLLALVQDPALREVHALKTHATAMTFSFPAQRFVTVYASPRLSVALVLALAAALVHLGSVLVLVPR